MKGNKKAKGRPLGVKTVDIHYKMSKDLYDSLPKHERRNKYINDAVREKMESDGYLISPEA